MKNRMSTDRPDCITEGIKIQGGKRPGGHPIPDESRVCRGRRPSDVPLFPKVLIKKPKDTFNFKDMTSGMNGEFE